MNQAGIGAHRAHRAIIYQSINVCRRKKMEKVKRNGWKVAFLAVAALMCSHVLFGDAANWDPPGPPAPTMTSLDEIYNAMSPSISQRQGFAKHFHCPAAATTTILTVPSGKRFVLRKLQVGMRAYEWEISGGPNLHIDARICYTKEDNAGDHFDLIWDFPDGCAVVDGPNDLTFTNTHTVAIDTHFVGYFYDVP
jgi:hypothetical protein